MLDLQPSTVLITGGAGFIGSHLADTMLEQGHNILVIDNLSIGRIENIRHLLHIPVSILRAPM